MLIILLGRIAQIVLMLALTKVATTLLVPSEFGHLSLITTLISLFSLVLVNPVGMFINRRLHGWSDAGTLLVHLRGFAVYLCSVAILSAVITYAITAFGWMDAGSRAGWLIGLVSGSVIVTTLNQTYIYALNMLERRVWFVGLSVATLAINLGVSVALVHLLGAHAEYWLGGALTAQAICTVGAALILNRHFIERTLVSGPWMRFPDRARAFEIFVFAWPVSLAVGLTWVQAQSYRFFVEAKLGAEQLGLFVAGYAVSAGIMGAFEAVLMAYFVPEFYRRVSSDSETQQSEAWNLYASAILPSLLLTAFFVALFASPLTKLLLGSRFHDVAVYTMFGAAAELARTYAGAYGLIAHARMKTRLLLIPYGLGAVVAVGLVFALVPTFGLLGVAAALVASSWCGVLGMHWSMRRQLRISLPFSLTAEALVYAAVLALLAWGSTFISIDSSIGLFISVKAFLTVGLAGLAYLGFQYRLLRRPISQLKVGRA